MAPDSATIADPRVVADRGVAIVLAPVSHPELDAIRIDEELFAIGRTEAPFASYAPDVVADLSRRHARLFCEYGSVYIVDLGSKNGTTVNGADIRQKISMLHDGDEICLGGALCYRVQLSDRAHAPKRAGKLLSLTLAPEHGELGIQPIVVTRFPFLISKADDAFARYKNEFPHQVNYISRRHAHIFLKGGEPFVEDLGSTNGTFVAGKRLDEHAVALKDGDVLAFGGHHFVYKVSLQQEPHEVDPTVTKLTTAAHSLPQAAQAAPADADKTTFVAAADSFLDIFCVDPVQPQEEEVNAEAAGTPDEGDRKPGRWPAGGKFAAFSAELAQAFAGGGRRSSRRARRWAAVLAVLVGAVALLAYFNGATEREISGMLAGGNYGAAAQAAADRLQGEPDNAALRALATEAQLKADVPRWLDMLRERQFDRAHEVIAAMKDASRPNAELQPLVGELEWMGSVEQFVAGRGGPDAPIRIYADEETIRALIRRWDTDPQGHQRAFATISSHVPAFRDAYAGTLSHLRKLQSDESVYLAAMERLKAAIGTELERDRPEALETVLKEYAEKYPRLGLDNVRGDLRRYTAIRDAVREKQLGSLAALLARAQFATPPFQAQFRKLAASGEFPPEPVLQQYRNVANAWQQGDVDRTFAGLQQMASGPWADAAARDLERKKAVADRFAALQQARGAPDYEDRLLSFYALLDAEQDTHFVRAVEPDIAQLRDKALARAQQLLGSAQAQWQQYRDDGGIEGAQRLESTVSTKFRTQAGRLAGADADARQGLRIYAQLKAERPAQWRALHDEIRSEAQLQRRSLLESRAVLEPRVLKAKLGLLGEEDDDETR